MLLGVSAERRRSNCEWYTMIDTLSPYIKFACSLVILVDLMLVGFSLLIYCGKEEGK